jgi:hypothetical protein
VNRTGYEGKTPSSLIMPRSSLTAQCSATLPSETRNQCDCWAAKCLPVGGMPQSSPSWVAVHVPRTRYSVPVRGGVLDVETVVGEDGEQPFHYVLVPAALVLGGAGGVVEVLGRDELVDGVEVMPVPNLLDVPAYHALLSSAVMPSSLSRFPSGSQASLGYTRRGDGRITRTTYLCRSLRVRGARGVRPVLRKWLKRRIV